MNPRPYKLNAIASMPLTNLQNIDKKQAHSCAKAGIISINDLLNQHAIDEFAQRTGIGALSAVDHIRKAEMACLEAPFDLDVGYTTSLNLLRVSELCTLSEKALRELSGAPNNIIHQVKEDASTLVACLDQKVASELTLAQLLESKVFYDSFMENRIGDVWLVRENEMPGSENAELAYTEDGMLMCPGGDREGEQQGTVSRLFNPLFVGPDDSDYQIEARMLYSGNETDWGKYGVQAIVFRSQSIAPDDFLNNCYKFQWSGNQIDADTWSLEQRVNNEWKHLVESKEHPLPFGRWYRMAVETRGTDIICKVDFEDGQGWRDVIQHNTREDEVVFSNGTVGLFCCWNYRPQYQMIDYYEVRKFRD
jgi:hypothetical protein